MRWRQGMDSGHNACFIYEVGDDPMREGVVCQVFGLPVNRSIEEVDAKRFAEGMAQARMIAAAPDLLAASKAWLALADYSMEAFGISPHGDEKPVMDALREAIRKAEGK